MFLAISATSNEITIVRFPMQLLLCSSLIRSRIAAIPALQSGRAPQKSCSAAFNIRMYLASKRVNFGRDSISSLISRIW